MNKKNIIILVISIIFFLFALAVFIYANSLKSKNDNNSTTVEKTTIIDSKTDTEPYFYDIDGQKINLSSFDNKPQVILLWKSDNAKSYEIINLFQKYYEDFKDSINFLAINVNEAKIDLNLIDNVKAANFSIPIYFDTDLVLINQFTHEKLPYIAFVNKDGNIDKEASETIDEDTFLANLELMAIE